MKLQSLILFVFFGAYLTAQAQQESAELSCDFTPIEDLLAYERVTTSNRPANTMEPAAMALSVQQGQQVVPRGAPSFESPRAINATPPRESFAAAVEEARRQAGEPIVFPEARGIDVGARRDPYRQAGRPNRVAGHGNPELTGLVLALAASSPQGEQDPRFAQCVQSGLCDAEAFSTVYGLSRSFRHAMEVSLCVQRQTCSLEAYLQSFGLNQWHAFSMELARCAVAEQGSERCNMTAYTEAFAANGDHSASLVLARCVSRGLCGTNTYVSNFRLYHRHLLALGTSFCTHDPGDQELPETTLVANPQPLLGVGEELRLEAVAQ